VRDALYRALGRVKLVADHPVRFQAGEGTAVSAWIEPPGALIGRSPDADVVVLDPAKLTSRRHALIEPVGGWWVVRDLGSSHGTELRSEGETWRLDPGVAQSLEDGMWLGLGGAAWIRIGIEQPATRGSRTMATDELPAAASRREPLVGRAAQVAEALTRPFRERPPRREVTPIPQIVTDLNWSEGTIRNELRKLARLPGVHLTEPPGTAQRTRELAVQLVRLYPDQLGPEKPAA
jgi:hypothetical protein